MPGAVETGHVRVATIDGKQVLNKVVHKSAPSASYTRAVLI